MNTDTVAAALDFLALDRDVPAAELTTWRVGGPISLLATVNTHDELARLCALVPEAVDVLVVGRGSNLLVADEGFAGLGLRLCGAFEEITFDDATVSAGGAVALPVLARRCAAAGRSGLEFYVGIPGTVGGAVRMNAGGHGRETAEVLLAATIHQVGNSSVEQRESQSLGFAYRTSNVGARTVVAEARFATSVDAPQAVVARVDEIVRWRRQHQPGGANAGSVFSNPPDDSAGRLIDACGLSGLRVGGASVSEKHANFIQTEPGATAGDVAALISEVARRVAAATGVELATEVHLVGFEGPPHEAHGMRP